MPAKKKKKAKWVCPGVISGLGSDSEQVCFLQPLNPIDEEPEPSFHGNTCTSTGDVSSMSTVEGEEISDLDLEIYPSSSPVRLTSGDFANQSSITHQDAPDLGDLGVPPSIVLLDSPPKYPNLNSVDPG
ncbi:hypothetical protein Dimus_005855 [Dionaea muscipula]